MGSLLNYSIFGNPMEDYVWFACIVLTGLVFKRLLSRWLTYFVYRFIKSYSTGVSVDRLVVLLNRPLGFFILVLTFYFAFDQLSFPPTWKLVSADHFGLRMILYRGFKVSILFAVTWIILRIIDFFGLVMLHKASTTDSRSDDQLVSFLKESIKIVVAVFSFFFILGAVFHINVASLIAGLGIGGLAVALAAKESLENLLGSFTIFLDEPFVVGDLVQIGHVTGHVEKIGFRSTRIRTVEKSYVTVPNKKMVEAELDNLSQRTARRAKFMVYLTYDGTPENIKAFVHELREYLESRPQLDKSESKVSVYELGTGSIQVMVQYYVTQTDWDTYIKVREEINYVILETVRRNGCTFGVTIDKKD